MNNNTRDDYKKAIRTKYEIEKEGEFSNYFLPTSQANLRNLCWVRFETNTSKDDSSIFFSVFDFDFDLSKSRHFSTNMTDKFRPVVTFLTGKKEPAKFSTVELAAILVDFHPRPFKKFNKEGCIEIDNSVEETLKPVNNPHVPEVIFIKNDDNEEFEKSNGIKEERAIPEENLNEDLCKEENLDKTAFSNEENILTVDEILIEAPEEEILKEIKTTKQAIKPLELFLGFKKELPQKESIIKRNKWIRIGVVSFLVVLGSYYFPEKKECMQWTSDHYEIVDCDVKKEGFIPANAIEVLDPGLVNLKKITICDTTTCFDKNGVAIIWYAKTANGVDFFNEHGRHPENNKPLKPVTQYIIDKYVK
ncbi:hypothetical protein [Flavobacterium chungangense]|uniref:Uncharacterized protein n=1 Tax=Flavobacterium chungangense TaxID=554283 RepID=A0A6V6Z5F3_9FLAO|nr:hypothetical protein [Flavobacterium chungangense]CAD0007003.1 hypothetical protein FLACHUCJ7_03089 [Flavobacterium chungangense]